MIRENGKYDDPINPDPADKIHNTDPCNLMNKAIKGINIEERQCVIVNDSPLLKEWSPPSDIFRNIRLRGSLFIRDDDSSIWLKSLLSGKIIKMKTYNEVETVGKTVSFFCSQPKHD